MANDKTTRVKNRVETQEKALLKMAAALCRTATDALSLAEDFKVSDYDKVRGLAPLLKEMGALGDVFQNQIDWHNDLAKLAASNMKSDELARSGIRDKDDN